MQLAEAAVLFLLSCFDLLLHPASCDSVDTLAVSIFNIVVQVTSLMEHREKGELIFASADAR